MKRLGAVLCGLLLATSAWAQSLSPPIVSASSAIGVATGTSLALGGCTIGTNALCATGTANISGAITAGGAINGLSITPNASTGLTISANKTLTASNTITLAGTDGTTITFQATDTYVGRATTDTLTNKTFNSAGTGNVLQISGVTVSRGQLPGTSTNDNATAGNVGEVADITAAANAVSLTSASPSNVITGTNLLTAGDWEVSAIGYMTPAATTTVSYCEVSLSTTSATRNLTVGQYATNEYAGNVLTAAENISLTIPSTRFVVAGTTTVYLVTQCSFGTSTMTAGGSIHARRVR